MSVEGASVDYMNRGGVITAVVNYGVYTFTLRGLEILRCKRDGMKDREIADAFGLSWRTIANELQNLRNTNAETTVSLALYANAHGLLDGFLDELRESVGKWGQGY